MGSGLLRELLVLEKIGYGGLRDGSGCANLFGAKTHALGSTMRNCRTTMRFYKRPSGTSGSCIRRPLRLLGAQEFVFVESCVLYHRRWGPGL